MRNDQTTAGVSLTQIPSANPCTRKVRATVCVTVCETFGCRPARMGGGRDASARAVGRPLDGLLQKEEIPRSYEGVGRLAHLTGCATTTSQRGPSTEGVHESMVEVGDQDGGNRDPARPEEFDNRQGLPVGGSDMLWFVAQEDHLTPVPVS